MTVNNSAQAAEEQDNAEPNGERLQDDEKNEKDVHVVFIDDEVESDDNDD